MRLSPHSARAAWARSIRARDTRLDRTVAIKVLPSEVAGDPDVRSRFEREARAIAALDHPHICGIYVSAASIARITWSCRISRARRWPLRLEKGPPFLLDQAPRIAVERGITGWAPVDLQYALGVSLQGPGPAPSGGLTRIQDRQEVRGQDLPCDHQHVDLLQTLGRLFSGFFLHPSPSRTPRMTS